MSFFESFWTLFRGVVRVWNDYIRGLQGQVLDEEKQLMIPPSSSYPQDGPVPIRKFTESDFQWNLNGQQLKETKNDFVNQIIQDFAHLNIDIYQMVLDIHTFPDPTFLHKRYLNTIRNEHPDKGGDYHSAIRLNVAKDQLGQFYNNENDQVEFLEYIYNSQPKSEPIRSVGNPTSTHQSPNHVDTTISTAPLVILYLVGIAAGTILVLVANQPKKKSITS